MLHFFGHTHQFLFLWTSHLKWTMKRSSQIDLSTTFLVAYLTTSWNHESEVGNLSFEVDKKLADSAAAKIKMKFLRKFTVALGNY